VIFVKGTLNGLFAVVSLVLTAVLFYVYTTSGDRQLFFWLAILCLIATLVFGGLFLSGRVNRREDIHITE
jgi:hypothetical protein